MLEAKVVEMCAVCVVDLLREKEKIYGGRLHFSPMLGMVRLTLGDARFSLAGTIRGSDSRPLSQPYAPIASRRTLIWSMLLASYLEVLV